ncbi:MAG: hypothetical protein MR266_03400 [Erysipelotrichaceae bacterium]|nr:hypothetical protein [Erysipelotrichaceae bacterium]
MKKEGIVKKYDGYTGIINDYLGKEYLLLKKETLEKINEKDIVIFDPEVVITSEEDRNVARFVKKKVLKP